MVFVAILALVLLICCWWIGDCQLVTKVILTLLFAASWGLLYVGVAWVIVAHCVFIVVTGCITFGVEFLSRRMR